VTDDGLEIRQLETAAEMRALERVLQQVWGTSTPFAGVELLRALAHGGGYVAAAYDADNVVGASFGFLARHHGETALHSHVTGILPGVQRTGIGRAMKQHQRAWATKQGLRWVTWTFDPLVRRNAWFNIGVLGADIAEYLVDFYGPMTDSVNANDESDRLLVAWSCAEPMDRGCGEGASDGGSVDASDGEDLARVPTPDDVVALRRTDPGAARRWRLRIREELGGRMARGGSVVGFTRGGDYVVRGGR
jgi:predicted GNAT superfamily acetyltransferase